MKPKELLQVALGILTATGGFVDAGAIATAGAAGAQFGLGLIWALLLATLAIILLVEMSGRLAAVSGTGYADAIRERFGFRFYLLPLSSEVVANTLLLAADFGGMAIALSLVTGISWHVLTPFVALLVFAIVWRAPFGFIENLPSILGLVTLTFWIGVSAHGGPDGELLRTLWRPEIKQNELAEYLFLAAAILGAIISPYLLFFYSSGAREERWTRRSISTNRLVAVVGMTFGSTTAIALIVLAALVLQPLGIAGGTLPEIGLSMAAPLGKAGAVLFASALFVTCLGAALEVSLGMSYNVSQGFGWEWGEEKKPAQAPRFNLLLVVFLGVALALTLLGIDPLQLALMGSAFTALILPISLAPFLVLMNDRAYLGDFTNGALSNIATVGILAIAFVVAVVSMPLLLLSGG
jgi:Mn2+/Fe2+ NRAMP family transporter